MRAHGHLCELLIIDRVDAVARPDGPEAHSSVASTSRYRENGPCGFAAEGIDPDHGLG